MEAMIHVLSECKWRAYLSKLGKEDKSSWWNQRSSLAASSSSHTWRQKIIACQLLHVMEPIVILNLPSSLGSVDLFGSALKGSSAIQNIIILIFFANIVSFDRMERRCSRAWPSQATLATPCKRSTRSTRCWWVMPTRDIQYACLTLETEKTYQRTRTLILLARPRCSPWLERFSQAFWLEL